MKLILIYAILSTTSLYAYLPFDAYDNNIRFVYDGHYYMPCMFYHDPQCPECKKKDKELEDYAINQVAE
jgi:hypothetical protein